MRIDRDGAASHLTHLPYARFQADNGLLPGSPYYVEVSRRHVRVWDLETGEQVADAMLPEDTVDVEIGPHGWAAWAISQSGQVHRFSLPALTSSFAPFQVAREK